MKKEALEARLKEIAEALAINMFQIGGFGDKEACLELVERITGIDDRFLALRKTVLEKRMEVHYARTAATVGAALNVERLLQDISTYAMVREFARPDRAEELKEELRQELGAADNQGRQ